MASLEDDGEMKRTADRVWASDPGHPVPLGRQPIAARIEDLANQVATAGRELTDAREEYQRAASVREQATRRFIEVTDALMQAIHEHREGAPEGAPYPRDR